MRTASLITALCLVSVGCQSTEPSIRIDVGELVTRAAQSAIPIDRFRLTVSGPGIEEPIVAELDPEDPVFELAIPAGADRRFLVEANTASGVPVFWGELITPVDPRSDREIVIPTFPAGRIDLTLNVFGVDASPERLPITFEAVEPREDQRARFVVDGAGGRLRQALPTGEHRISVGLDRTSSVLQAIPSETVITVTQADVVEATINLAPPDFCNAQLGQTPDLDSDGLNCVVDCDDTNPNCGADCTDQDGDGFCIDTDCDDSPSGGSCQTECGTFFDDDDDDGFGEDTTAQVACLQPANTVTVGGDCDDSRPGCSESCVDADLDTFCGVNDCDDGDNRVRPDAEEIAGDTIDSNCDGLELCYRDVDGDGDGDRNVALVSTAVISCDQFGLSRSGTDCDDTNPALSFLDSDGDGFISCVDIGGIDCDEGNAEVHSEKPENCTDGIDNNCDGLIDFFDEECVDFLNRDDDGYNESATSPRPDCEGADSLDADNDGESVCDGDCDDTDPTVNTRAPLRCDRGLPDSNCNVLDDAVECLSCVDADQDGYCNDVDCDDNDPDRNFDDNDRDGFTTCSDFVDCDDDWPLTPIPAPERIEFCFDGRDNDCDGFVDAADSECFCPDLDGDGFACNDCDDDPRTGADCIFVDECIDLPVDQDGDLFFADGAATRSTCIGTPRFAGDCDDSRSDVYPGAPEICEDGINQNCSELGSVALDDNDLDLDGDGAISAACGGADCDDLDPLANTDDLDGDGFTACEELDDLDPSSKPDELEVCDGVDNDQDGTIDNFLPGDTGADQDSDGIPDCLDGCPDVADLPIVSSQPAPQVLRIEWSRNNQGAPIDAIVWSAFINGSFVGSVSDGSLSVCPVTSTVSSDIPLSAFPWSGDGSDTIRIEGTDSPTETVSAMLFGFDSNGLGIVDTFEDYFGTLAVEPCTDPSPCNGSDCPQPDVPFPTATGFGSDEDGDGIGDACDCSTHPSNPTCPPGCVAGTNDQDFDGFFTPGPGCDPSPAQTDCDDAPEGGEFANPGIKVETVCEPFEGIDNDCDGLFDLDDPDCFGFDAANPKPVLVPLDADFGGAVATTRFDFCRADGENTGPGASCGGSDGERFYVELDLIDPTGVGDQIEVFNDSATNLLLTEIDEFGEEVGCLSFISAFTSGVIPADAPLIRLFAKVESGELACSGFDSAPVALTFRYVDIDPVFTNDFDNDGIDDSVDPCIDEDGDGYGRDDPGEQNCPQGDAEDCDDNAKDVFPGASEVCDALDNDCDGDVDEGFVYADVVVEDFSSENPFLREPVGWNTYALSGSSADWGPTMSTASGFPFETIWIGTDGGFSSAPAENSALETNGYSVPPDVDLLVQFDSYTNNDGGCPDTGPDGEGLEFNDGTGWKPIIQCPNFPLHAFGDSQARRLSYPIPVAPGTESLRLRWRFNSGGSSNDGWYISNVRLLSCAPE
ncbi:MAG: MopE-related protein [Myxococcota bacterium]